MPQALFEPPKQLGPLLLSFDQGGQLPVSGGSEPQDGIADELIQPGERLQPWVLLADGPVEFTPRLQDLEQAVPMHVGEDGLSLFRRLVGIGRLSPEVAGVQDRRQELLTERGFGRGAPGGVCGQTKVELAGARGDDSGLFQPVFFGH